MTNQKKQPEKTPPSPAPAVAPAPEKKSKAGIIVLIIVIVLIILIGGCSTGGYFAYKYFKDKAVDIIDELENVNVNLSQNENSNVNKRRILNRNINTNSGAVNANLNSSTSSGIPLFMDTWDSASSTLTDTTGIGFDYSSYQVLDLDWSTSWCEAATDDGIGEWLQLDFTTPGTVSALGIVPGYARDVETYFDNNRISSLILEFSDGSSVEKVLDDVYGAQVLQFPAVTTDYIKIIVNDVYAGYIGYDTCIAEVDIWSDWVVSNDPDSAQLYYETYLKDYALYPPSEYFVETIMAIDIDEYDQAVTPVPTYSAYAPYFVAHATLQGEIDEYSYFEIEWYYGDTLITWYDVYHWEGNPYIYSILHPYELPADLQPLYDLGENWPIGEYSALWYKDGVLAETVNFFVSPQ